MQFLQSGLLLKSRNSLLTIQAKIPKIYTQTMLEKTLVLNSNHMQNKKI